MKNLRQRDHYDLRKSVAMDFSEEDTSCDMTRCKNSGFMRGGDNYEMSQMRR